MFQLHEGKKRNLLGGQERRGTTSKGKSIIKILKFKEMREEEGPRNLEAKPGCITMAEIPALL